MSAHEYEAGPPLLGEQQPEAEYTRTLQRAFLEFDPETREAVHAQLWAATDKLLANILPAEQREGVKIAAGIMEWYCLGQPGDDLPAGLVVTHDEHDNIEFRLDDRIPFINHSLSEVAERIGELGFDDTLEDLERKIAESEPEIEEAIRGIIESSAEYRLLMSFESNNPATAPLPLTPFWRQIREEQIKGEVRARHQLSETDEIEHGMPAANDLRRHLRHLDDETMPRSGSEPADDEVARARKWAMPYLRAAYEKSSWGGGKTIDRIAYDPGNGVYVYAKDEEESYTEIYDISHDAAICASAELFIGPKEQQPVVIDFLYGVMSEVGDPRNAGSIRSIVEAAIEESINDVSRELLMSTQEAFAKFASNYDNYINLLHAPDTRATDGYTPTSRNAITTQPLNGDWRHVFSSYAALATKQELRGLKDYIIGHVEAYGPDNFRGPGRLIMAESSGREIPLTYEGTPDIRLQLPRWTISGDAPFIPGYQLVSWPHYNTYEFIVDPAGDPYSRCDVAIDSARLDELIGAYEKLGLADLAEGLRAASTVTVHQLSELIAQTSIYHLPDEVVHNSYESFNAASRNTDELSDFEACVKDGVLYVQCTGASQFLKLSLEMAFGDYSAHTVGGLVLWSDTPTINAAGHEQTIFNHDGRRYILDATPSAADTTEDDPVGVLPLAGYHAQHYAQVIERSAPDTLPAELQVGRKVVQEVTWEEQVAELHGSLQQQLQAYFEAGNQRELYEKLLQLPSFDPARRTMELYVQYQNGTLSPEAVTARAAYIDACAAAETTVKQQYRMDHYPQSLLTSLSHMANRLNWLIEERDTLAGE